MSSNEINRDTGFLISILNHQDTASRVGVEDTTAAGRKPKVGQGEGR